MKSIPAYFLGGNTADGFVSLYEGFCPADSGCFLWIIKGGPGCGKSTFMKAVADCAEYDGLLVERIYCSGDPNSLDAILIPAWKVAYMDGTSPHCREADYPAASAAYLDLGKYYVNRSIKPLLKPIMKLTNAYKESYREAYRLLGTLRKVPRKCIAKEGIFLRAITCGGIIDLRPSLYEKTSEKDYHAKEGLILVRNPLFSDCLDGYFNRENGKYYEFEETQDIGAAQEIACPVLKRAKDLHDELEALYHPFVNFEGVVQTAKEHIAMHRADFSHEK